MAQNDDDEADKSHDPTQHKLDEARKKGEIARSADLNTAAAYGGILVTALTAGAASVERVSGALMVLIDQSGELAPLFFDGPAATPALGLLSALALGLAAWFVIPASFALLSVLAQRSFVVAPEKLMPRLSRIDPVQNAKNKYGPSGLFEFAKSFAKLLLYSLLLGAFLGYRFSEMGGADGAADDRIHERRDGNRAGHRGGGLCLAVSRPLAAQPDVAPGSQGRAQAA